MTTRRPKHREHGHEHEHEHKHKHYPDRDREDSGDDPAMHARIIARRWEGSPPPTAERYARALRQWQALPGAVVSPATYVTVAAETASADSADEEGAP
jgi:hypothetical protein